MSKISKIKSRIKDLESELKWLKTRIEEGESNYVDEEEVSWDSINSQVEYVESSSNDLIDEIKDLIEIIEELI